jgi:hypothetical protein
MSHAKRLHTTAAGSLPVEQNLPLLRRQSLSLSHDNSMTNNPTQ